MKGNCTMADGVAPFLLLTHWMVDGYARDVGPAIVNVNRKGEAMRAHTRNGRGTVLGILTVGAMVIGSLGVAKAADQLVDWTNQVNVAARGNVLEKVAGCQGCDDAGAVSRQIITNGNGYIEFTVGEGNSFVV